MLNPSASSVSGMHRSLSSWFAMLSSPDLNPTALLPMALLWVAAPCTNPPTSCTGQVAACTQPATRVGMRVTFSPVPFQPCDEWWEGVPSVCLCVCVTFCFVICSVCIYMHTFFVRVAISTLRGVCCVSFSRELCVGVCVWVRVCVTHILLSVF